MTKKKIPATPASPASPVDSGYGGDSAQEPPKKRIRTGAKKPASAVYHTFSSGADTLSGLTIHSQSESRISPIEKTSGMFEHLLKLESPRSFTYQTTTNNENGDIMIRFSASKAFPLMKLPTDIRKRIFKHVMMPENNPKAKIVVNSTTTGVKSTNFAEKMKHRVGLLTVNKKIYEETLPLIYGNHIKFDDNRAVSTFMNRIGLIAPNHMSFIEIMTYKKDSGNALSALARCPELKRIHISTGVGVGASPSKAAKGFHAENSFFYETVGQRAGDKFRGMDLVRFGLSEKCFSVKEGDGTKRRYTDAEREEFRECMERLLK
ncbi:hypothetical protein BDZ85DRAFT_317579 [Elsinoe ampelina]|uniref:Uncharacterized protein n=1 Tax=Elsinoe ampelina TaxID=302913 RepID=A0A6A6GH03_9PEZI|nr:hypothetical protein BDZ85DRAFT_317579 [Elsinoe ampelina]